MKVPFTAAAGLLLAVLQPAAAQTIATRADLNSLLGAGAENESLSGLPITPGNGNTNPATVINSSNYLTQTDLSFSVASGIGVFQFNGPGYYGAIENEILVDDGGMAMNFSGTVNAFGVDLRGYDGYADTETVTIYGVDDTTVLATFANVLLTGDGVPQFFGYESSSAIGEVVFSIGETWGWSGLVGNITYGSADAMPMPEPESCALLGIGGALLVGMRRRQRAN